jgi:uncharacterized membrane protein
MVFMDASQELLNADQPMLFGLGQKDKAAGVSSSCCRTQAIEQTGCQWRQWLNGNTASICLPSIDQFTNILTYFNDSI